MSERIRRPKLERTEPFRGWSTLFTIPGPASRPSAEDAARPEGKTDDDIVSRAVDLGYRVIDDYIRQGQKAAQRLSERAYGPEAATSDMQDLAARMTQYASELTGIWMDAIQRAASGNAWTFGREPVARPTPAPSPQATRDGSPVSAGDPDNRARVVIEVAAHGPAEVALDLRTTAATRRLIVHALRAVDAEKPRLTEITFQPATDDDPARLRVVVPPQQPPGIYAGLLIDEESSRPVGTLSVTIGPRPKAKRP